MSRRESRDPDSNRRRSRYDRQPSPKRFRRDAKPEVERAVSKTEFDVRHGDRKPRQRLQDAASLEASAAAASKSETRALNKESANRHSAYHEATKHSSDQAQVPRSRSYYQHEESGSGWKGDQRAATERGWWRDSRDELNGGKAENEKSQHQARGEDYSVWRHDKFQENNDDPSPPARKRPAFREKKILDDSENAKKTEPEEVRIIIRREKSEEGRDRRRIHERPNRGESDRHGYAPRDRFNGGWNYRAIRDRFNYGRHGFRGNGKRDEKWEHDLFNEANKSPVRKNEEEQIAEVEALLAS